MYYRRDDEILQQASEVHAPSFVLTPENHAEQQYPADGWYWFDTLDEALIGMISPPDAPTVTALQALLALDALGLSEAYETWCNDPARTFTEKAFITRAQTWKRTDQTFNAAADALGKTDEERDQFFELAKTL